MKESVQKKKLGEIYKWTFYRFVFVSRNKEKLMEMNLNIDNIEKHYRVYIRLIGKGYAHEPKWMF